MNGFEFALSGTTLTALPSGALWWEAQSLLAVADLHLGRSGRFARNAGALLPPYETIDTLMRLDADLSFADARHVICLGDSFDDLAAADLTDELSLWIARMQAGRRWTWLTGNHDPAPVSLPGEHLAELEVGPLTFRHIAREGASGEVSGHYHPKTRIAGQARRCFLLDTARLILPAYGTYTGGLFASAPALDGLMGPGALAILTGAVARPLPMRT